METNTAPATPVVRPRHVAKERYLSDRFTDPVVMAAEVVECRNHDIIFRCQTHFGLKGSLLREFTLRDSIPSFELKQRYLANYVRELYELVGIVEDCAASFRHSRGDFTIYKVLEAESPVMVKASLKGNMAKLEVFGAGIYDLTITHDRTRGKSLSPFSLRVEELVNPIRTHLAQIDNLPLQALKGSQV